MEKFPKSYAVVFIGHGSRNKSATEEFLQVLGEFSRRNPDIPTFHGFVELEKPSILEILLDVASKDQFKKIIIIPLFLFSSRHIKNDLPIVIEKIKTQFPNKEFYCSETIKSHPLMVDLIHKKIEQVKSEKKNKKALLIVGRGASDPDSNGEFQKIVRMVEEKDDYIISLPTYIGITKPLVDDSLEFISRIRPDELIIVPYFLFKGRLLEKLEKQVSEFKSKYPWIKIKMTGHLGVNENLLEYIHEKVEEGIGVREENPLSCITCQYRPEQKEIANDIKGTEALLWSVRHLYTHSQAKPHEYPHKNLKKHVLVCGNIDCSKKGSIELTSKLRRLIRENDLGESYRVTKTSCMGRCGEGPAVVVYPDGVWYREVAPEDSEDIFNQHIKKDRIVARLVDDIMM